MKSKVAVSTMKAFKSLCILLLAALPFAANAQDFPNHLVRIVVPYPPGGGVDGLARPLADRLSRIWQQPVIVENKQGAATTIGGEFVARAPADGYTLLLTSDSSITSNPFLFKESSLDPIRDLKPVTQLIDLHQMVVVNPSVTAGTLKELVALAKQNPNALNYGSYGNGSQPHLLFEVLRAETGAQIMQVPYGGIAPAITATVAGDVQVTLGGPQTTGALIKAGRLKALAIGRKERIATFPDVPTLAEAGFPDIDPRSWFGLFAPKDTPDALVDKIQHDVATIFADPEFSKPFIEQVGYTSVASSPAAFHDFIMDDLEYKKHLISTAGIKPE
jgi:tripartite-type tricarboxylate transporter receptor subunit TctC